MHIICYITLAVCKTFCLYFFFKIRVFIIFNYNHKPLYYYHPSNIYYRSFDVYFGCYIKYLLQCMYAYFRFLSINHPFYRPPPPRCILFFDLFIHLHPSPSFDYPLEPANLPRPLKRFSSICLARTYRNNVHYIMSNSLWDSIDQSSDWFLLLAVQTNEYNTS